MATLTRAVIRVASRIRYLGAGIGEAGERRHHRGAVHQGQPLFRTQPQRHHPQFAIDIRGAGEPS